MKEHPILFSGEMVSSILDGRKTQTRRVIKDQWLVDYPDDDPSFFVHLHSPKCGGYCDFSCDNPSPYGVPGDRLWVRETFCSKCGGDVCYRAGNIQQCDSSHKWKPSIHMPRRASRITLEILHTWVERLQDISVDDAIRSGVNCAVEPEQSCESCGCCDRNNLSKHISSQCNPRSSFAETWDSINGKKPGCTWADNPWVWAVEFKRVEK